MTRYQVGTWVFCLVIGLSVGLILNQPDFYALLAFTLLAYPVFCDVINWLSYKVKNYLGGNNDIQNN